MHQTFIYTKNSRELAWLKLNDSMRKNAVAIYLKIMIFLIICS